MHRAGVKRGLRRFARWNHAVVRVVTLDVLLVFFQASQQIVERGLASRATR